MVGARSGSVRDLLRTRVISRLVALDFTNQAILLGAGLLISLLPFLIFISAFADERIDDDLALHLGLDHHAAQIVSHLSAKAGSHSMQQRWSV